MLAIFRMMVFTGLMLIGLGCADERRFDALRPEAATVKVQSGGNAAGRGFFVSPDGTIVTARHVVADAKSIAVTLPDGRTLGATLLNEDKEADVALLKVAAQVKGQEFRILHLNDEDAEPGMHVRAVRAAGVAQGVFD